MVEKLVAISKMGIDDEAAGGKADPALLDLQEQQWWCSPK